MLWKKALENSTPPPRLPHRLINCRSYKNFPNESFRECLLEKLSKDVFVNNDEGLQSDIYRQVLNQYAPQKIKNVRVNQMPFMPKQLSKEIMRTSRLRNDFLRNRTEWNKILYNKQGNKEITVYLFCENLREDTMITLI